MILIKVSLVKPLGYSTAKRAFWSFWAVICLTFLFCFIRVYVLFYSVFGISWIRSAVWVIRALSIFCARLLCIVEWAIWFIRAFSIFWTILYFWFLYVFTKESYFFGFLSLLTKGVIWVLSKDPCIVGFLSVLIKGAMCISFHFVGDNVFKVHIDNEFLH